MIPESLSSVANHLWQSTLFACAAGLLALALRNHSARIRYWIWATSSLKFLIPFSLLLTTGNLIEWRKTPAIAQSGLSLAGQISQPFTVTTNSSPVLAAVPYAPSTLPEILFGIWACGFIGITWSWWIRWRRVRAAVLSGTPVQLDAPIRAISSPLLVEPGVFGVFRPILLLPEGIFDRLAPAQMQAIIAHELCHVRHRDNLVAVVHTLIENAFWFHPLVWWIGKQMVAERERACDEEVLRLGNEPRAYAQGVLRVCELYLESDVASVAGVSGGNLRRRIEEIMSDPNTRKLGRGRKAMLVAAGILPIAATFVIGMLNGPSTRAQQLPLPKFEVASIRPVNETLPPSQGRSDSSSGRMPGIRCRGTDSVYTGVPLGMCIAVSASVRSVLAYSLGLNSNYILGPGWLDSAKYDIEAKASEPDKTTRLQLMAMMESLLADRFQLRVHREARQIAVYELRVGKNGPKLKESAADAKSGISVSTSSISRMKASATNIPTLAAQLTTLLDRPVVDKSGLAGSYDFTLEFAVDSALADVTNVASVFTAVQEQLGLRLEAAKGAQDFVIIDRVERPSEN